MWEGHTPVRGEGARHPDHGVRTGSAASLMADMRLHESYLTNGYLDTTVIDWVPGHAAGEPWQLLQLPPHHRPRRLLPPQRAHPQHVRHLEADVLAALRAEYPRIYTIGALTSLLRHDSSESDTTGLSLWKQDAECLTWLDTQEPCSVVYANFGSNTVLSPEKLAEFAWGLAASGHPFLWSIRGRPRPRRRRPRRAATGVRGRDGGRCYLTSWCPQEQPRRRRADGVLAGFAERVSEVMGSEEMRRSASQVEGGSGDGRQPRWILV
ncbi:hypothetical protein HU200_066471 [Digitaria exilis]|uniref:UDP-glycosyltransferase n=1 Tax=Digitaria exilis TaxID=1010633 RepID=A0A835DSV0_9POAL|nr:hypothetical protein HU200_066471 [Digitaria exilis]